MALFLSTLFRQFQIDPKAVRLLRHKDSRSDRGRTPYELWRDDRPAFDRYQSIHGIVHRSRLKPALLWASFVVSPAGETILANLYRAHYRGPLAEDTPMVDRSEVDRAGTCDVYDLDVDDRWSDLAGKLVVEWGSATRTWIQRADLQDKAIVEIRRVFEEPRFPGFSRFLEPLSRIEKLPRSWGDALRASRGVYLLVCPKSREQYVGSATGEDGFWGRWVEYARTGHGGNVALKLRDPSDYQVSILEVAGSAATPDEIVRMEASWKAKLRSREMGLNRN